MNVQSSHSALATLEASLYPVQTRITRKATRASLSSDLITFAKWRSSQLWGWILAQGRRSKHCHRKQLCEKEQTKELGSSFNYESHSYTPAPPSHHVHYRRLTMMIRILCPGVTSLETVGAEDGSYSRVGALELISDPRCHLERWIERKWSVVEWSGVEWRGAYLKLVTSLLFVSLVVDHLKLGKVNPRNQEPDGMASRILELQIETSLCELVIVVLETLTRRLCLHASLE
ncbi:hypothetical protein AXG93_1847s1360 [Marchantia polymorpha subsp. ruderalis]|uniref:Uncharacterized protein n=1 Tax=Marchantia polymorpha subsp. ruderalis TaxID=1480154 RepID=A0A176VGW0_MARPO|nr:hypothetical protein AXG93_1847s1360 [Marchantia polymorpha subsp. ruderalis]